MFRAPVSLVASGPENFYAGQSPYGGVVFGVSRSRGAVPARALTTPPPPQPTTANRPTTVRAPPAACPPRPPAPCRRRPAPGPPLTPDNCKSTSASDKPARDHQPPVGDLITVISTTAATNHDDRSWLLPRALALTPAVGTAPSSVDSWMCRGSRGVVLADEARSPPPVAWHPERLDGVAVADRSGPRRETAGRGRAAWCICPRRHPQPRRCPTRAPSVDPEV